MASTHKQNLAHTRPPVVRSLTAFAEALGSREGVDPIPPSQYLYFLDRDQPALQRVVAWVRSKTIRYQQQRNGGDGRSAWCVNSAGKALGLADMARELGMLPPNASRAWKEAEDLGLVRRDGRKLFLVGDVPKPAVGEQEGKCYLYRYLSPSLRRMVESWPEARQAEFKAVWEPAVKLADSIAANAIADARNVATDLFSTIHSHFGLPKTSAPKKPRPAVLEVPEQLNLFVKVGHFGSVQITSAAPRTEKKIAARTDNPILMDQRTDREPTKPSSSLLAVQQLAEALRIDDDAARELWAECSGIDEALTVEELVQLGQAKLRATVRTVRNPTGLLLNALPKMVKAHQREKAREALKPRAPEPAPREPIESDRPTLEEMATRSEDEGTRVWAREELAKLDSARNVG